MVLIAIYVFINKLASTIKSIKNSSSFKKIIISVLLSSNVLIISILYSISITIFELKIGEQDIIVNILL